MEKTRSVTFEPFVIRTPVELLRCAGVTKLEVNAGGGTITGDLRYGNTFEFKNPGELREYLYCNVSIHDEVSEDDLEAYLKTVGNDSKSESEPEPKFFRTEAMLAFAGARTIKLESDGYYIEYILRKPDGPFKSYSECYDVLAKSTEESETGRQEFLDWCKEQF